METKVKTGKAKKRNQKTAPKNNTGISPSKSIASLFGINKNETDGLVFQKKVRNEWQ